MQTSTPNPSLLNIGQMDLNPWITAIRHIFGCQPLDQAKLLS